MTASKNLKNLKKPIISYLELISLGKSFAKKDQYQIDATQEMVALGTVDF